MKPSKKPYKEQVPATKVQGKFVKEEKELAKYPAQSKVPQGQLEDMVLKLSKEDGFNKADAISVITLTKEMDGANKSDRKDMTNE